VRTRELVYLILLGVAVLTLSAIVMARDTSTDTELLATIGVLGGLAIVLTGVMAAVPAGSNGDNGRHHRREE
jgi:hypothetical protein